jgi:hypothetical protein
LGKVKTGRTLPVLFKVTVPVVFKTIFPATFTSPVWEILALPELILKSPPITEFPKIVSLLLVKLTSPDCARVVVKLAFPATVIVPLSVIIPPEITSKLPETLALPKSILSVSARVTLLAFPIIIVCTKLFKDSSKIE